MTCRNATFTSYMVLLHLLSQASRNHLDMLPYEPVRNSSLFNQRRHTVSAPSTPSPWPRCIDLNRSTKLGHVRSKSHDIRRNSSSTRAVRTHRVGPALSMIAPISLTGYPSYGSVPLSPSSQIRDCRGEQRNSLPVEVVESVESVKPVEFVESVELVGPAQPLEPLGRLPGQSATDFRKSMLVRAIKFVRDDPIRAEALYVRMFGYSVGGKNNSSRLIIRSMPC